MQKPLNAIIQFEGPERIYPGNELPDYYSSNPELKNVKRIGSFRIPTFIFYRGRRFDFDKLLRQIAKENGGRPDFPQIRNAINNALAFLLGAAESWVHRPHEPVYLDDLMQFHLEQTLGLLVGQIKTRSVNI